MKKTIIILITFLVCILMFSCRKNHTYRNKLIFKDKTANVYDSLIKMKILLKNLPKNSDDKNTNYEIRNGNIYINEHLIKENTKVNSVFTIIQQNYFVKIAKYLKRENISGAYYDQDISNWRFLYYYDPVPDFDDFRSILVVNSDQSTMNIPMDTILDYKNGIYLTAPIDAKIR